MKVLLHTCCSCCALGAVQNLRSGGHEVACFFYNPNIHPSSEYLARYESMSGFARSASVDLITAEYELEAYFKAINGNYSNRCPQCYLLRLNKTAGFAKENGFDAVSTTLLTSIYQDYDLIVKLGNKICVDSGMTFIVFDNRDEFRANQERSKELGMYRQKYCGCLFSERDRHQKKISQTLR